MENIGCDVEYEVLDVIASEDLVRFIYTITLRSKPLCYFVYSLWTRNLQIRSRP